MINTLLLKNNRFQKESAMQKTNIWQAVPIRWYISLDARLRIGDELSKVSLAGRSYLPMGAYIDTYLLERFIS